jgi:hypothetical protein
MSVLTVDLNATTRDTNSGAISTIPIRASMGEVALAAGPTTVVTNLRTVISATVSLKTSTAPGDDPVVVTVDFGADVDAGSLLISPWKTNGSDPTLVASTSSATVSWIAFGL